GRGHHPDRAGRGLRRDLDAAGRSGRRLPVPGPAAHPVRPRLVARRPRSGGAPERPARHASGGGRRGRAAGGRLTVPGTRTPRPARTFTTGPWTRWIRRIALLLIVGTAGWVLLSYSSLPSAVPTHFDLRGEPDAFGDRASALWLVGVMTATGALCGWLST